MEALQAGYTHYADANGDPDLRAALAAEVSREAGVAYGADQVLVTHGGTAGLAATVLATVNPGDRVIIPEPTYSLYADLVRFAGGVPVFVPTLDDFHLDLDRIEAALSGARLIVLCNPCNPTGAVYGAEELSRLAALLDGTDTLLISDEAYQSIIYDGRRFTSALSVSSLMPRLIYCQTFSKTYAMTGWRLGYVAAPRPLIEAIGCIHRTLNGAMNSAVQRAALRAIALGPEATRVMLEEYTRRRTYVAERIGRIEGLEMGPPEGTFYGFVRYHLDVPSSVLAERLMQAGVAVRAGSEYGPSGEHHVRLSFATSMAKLEEGLARIETALDALRLAAHVS